MYASKHVIDVTTNASGSATEYSSVITGKIVNIIYIKDSTNAYDDGVDFNITLDETEQTLWAESDVNSSKTVAPRQATHSTLGAALLYATGGEPVTDAIVAANDRVKIAVSSGGNTKTGRFIIVVS